MQYLVPILESSVPKYTLRIATNSLMPLQHIAKHLRLTGCGDVHPRAATIFPQCTFLLIDSCNNNFMDFWFWPRIFPQLKTVMIDTHPGEKNIHRRFAVPQNQLLLPPRIIARDTWQYRYLQNVNVPGCVVPSTYFLSDLECQDAKNLFAQHSHFQDLVFSGVEEAEGGVTKGTFMPVCSEMVVKTGGKN